MKKLLTRKEGIVIFLCCMAAVILGGIIMEIAEGAEIVANGATNQSFYMVMEDRNGDPNTNITVTTLDMYYVTDQNSVATKIDCTDLGSENAAHSDGGAYEMGTSGIYRFDFPDAAFRHGIGKRVNLWIDDAVTGTRTAFLCVLLSPPVDIDAIVSQTDSAANIDDLYDGTNFLTSMKDLYENTTWVGNIDDTFDGTKISLSALYSDNMTQANIETYTQTGAEAAAEVIADLVWTYDTNSTLPELVWEDPNASGASAETIADLVWTYDVNSTLPELVWEDPNATGASAAAVAEAVWEDPNAMNLDTAITSSQTEGTVGWYLYRMKRALGLLR